MRMLLYIALTLVGLLIAFIGVLGVLGSRLPETHTSSASIELPAPAERVFELIERVEDMPSWVPDITKVTRLPDVNGMPAYREEMGRNAFTAVATVFERPRRIKREITDTHGPFTGSWDHVIEPLGPDRCRLTLTEIGTIKAAIPRAIMHHFMGEDMFLKRFLGHVKAKLAG